MFGTNGRRAVAGAGIALMVAVGAGACGSGDDKTVDKAAFTKKLKAETGLDDKSGKFFDCLVKISLKYGDKGRIEDYVSGKKSFDNANIIESKDDADKAQKEMNTCAK